VTRSARTGRLRIAQTGAALAARRAPHSVRPAVHGTPKPRRRSARSTAVPAVNRHRGHSPSSASHTTRTVTAR
jgi:hypothetical protein